MPVTGAVRECAERATQPLIAAPPEVGCLAFAGLDSDGGLAGVSGERVAGWVAGAAVADLGQQLGGSHDAARVAEQRQEDLTVGVLSQRGRDLLSELLDLVDERRDRRDQREHDRPARDHLRVADASFGRTPELREQLGGLLPSRVVLAGEEPGQALCAEAASVGWAGVALQERERDRAVELREQADRTRPEPLELRPQLAAQRHASVDEILARAGQRPQRLGLIAVGLEPVSYTHLRA